MIPSQWSRKWQFLKTNVLGSLYVRFDWLRCARISCADAAPATAQLAGIDSLVELTQHSSFAGADNLENKTAKGWQRSISAKDRCKRPWTTKSWTEEKAETTKKLKDSQGSRRPTEKRLVIIWYHLLIRYCAKPKPSNPKWQLYFLDNNRLLFEGIMETH